jgi:hypothetical protein
MAPNIFMRKLEILLISWVAFFIFLVFGLDPLVQHSVPSFYGIFSLLIAILLLLMVSDFPIDDLMDRKRM